MQAVYRLRPSKQEKRMFNKIYELLKNKNDSDEIFEFFKKILFIIDELDHNINTEDNETRNGVIDEIIKILEFHKLKD